MSKSNTFENDLLKLFFNGTTIAGLASNVASGPIASLYVSLHSADPGEAGDQSTNEIAYTGYARQAVARTGSGWIVTGNSVSPAADVEFPDPTGGADGQATHFAIGTAAAGAGKILYSGLIAPAIDFGVGQAPPRITTGSTITEE